MACRVEGCGRDSCARGLCTMHYQRQRGTGNLGPAGRLRKGPTPRPAEERFWEKVDKDGPTPIERPDLGPCWIWTSNKNELGYGWFAILRDGRWIKRKAHTVAWELEIGQDCPADLVPDHLCRNPSCVNPSHIEWVTNRENILRGRSPSAMQARQTHCKRGHPLSGENLYEKPNGKRECRACRRLRDAAT